MKNFNVTLRFQFPSWDEKGGITYFDVPALSKSEAIKRARSTAEIDGHLTTGKGRYWFVATECEGAR